MVNFIGVRDKVVSGFLDTLSCFNLAKEPLSLIETDCKTSLCCQKIISAPDTASYLIN